jgi:uncharacterized protein with NRDE domain
MCLLFYDVRGDADLSDFPFKLIVANTRDEFYIRPTKEAFSWPKTDKRQFPVIAGSFFFTFVIRKDDFF